MAPVQGSLFAEQSPMTIGTKAQTRRNLFRDHTGRFSSKLQSQADNSMHKANMYKRMWQAELSRTEGLSKRIRQMTEDITRLKRENDLLKSEY